MSDYDVPDYDGGDQSEPLDVEVEDVPGTDLAVPGGTDVEPSDVVDGEIDPDDLEINPEILMEEGFYGVAYQPHAPRQATSDASSAATTGNGTSGGGFKWSKADRGPGGGAPGGGGGKKKRRFGRKPSGSGGSGGGVTIFSFFRDSSLLKTGSIGSGNALLKAGNTNAAGVSIGRPRPNARKR